MLLYLHHVISNAEPLVNNRSNIKATHWNSGIVCCDSSDIKFPLRPLMQGYFGRIKVFSKYILDLSFSHDQYYLEATLNTNMFMQFLYTIDMYTICIIVGKRL